ncbi:hypothetical protein BX666DRAFT_1861164 [Dichotomocladium elegans]|nr:hypothetical protein BX666DRAFT_1861164 [Dichotomocladium elegans]
MIHVGYHLANHIVCDIITTISVSNYVIITDAHLAQLHLPPLVSVFHQELSTHDARRLLIHILPPGEQTKSRAVKEAIEDFLLDNKCTRDTCLIALGGGVMGDLVGFVASTFMRGVPVVQIPTTLLAMVDSSIGGKTAVDTPHGKNLIGTFWQPERIYMDLTLLHTLPARELANGMAEVIKTAAMWSRTDFEQLEHASNELKAAIALIGEHPTESSDRSRALRDVLMNTILAAVRVKAEVVTDDEREGGLRGLLNFGHTVGHAMEMLLTPQWLHGECVAIGMLCEAEIAVQLGHCDAAVVDRIRDCCASYGLPVKLDTPLAIDDVMEVMKVDKKNEGAQKRIVLLTGVGTTLERRATRVTDTIIRKVLHQYLIPTETATPNILPAAEHESNTKPTLILCASGLALEWVQQTLTPAFLASSNGDYSVHSTTDGGNRGQLFIMDNIKKAAQEVANGKGNKTTVIIVSYTYAAGCTTMDDLSLEWYEYVLPNISNGEMQLPGALAFIQGLIGVRPRHMAAVPNPPSPSYFVTPTVHDYAETTDYQMAQWLHQADAIEFRVDLLKDHTSIAAVGGQLARLRQLTQLPIIFTIRTRPQAGQFDYFSEPSVYADLLVWACRWGCDFVDVEFTTLSAEQLDRVRSELRSRAEKIKCIASFHDPEHEITWCSPTMHDMYERASNLFPGAIVKLVGMAKTFDDNVALEMFRNQYSPSSIFINMGALGRFSRVRNKFLTPATHPSLPSPAAPGQLSIREITDLRSRLCC